MPGGTHTALFHVHLLSLVLQRAATFPELWLLSLPCHGRGRMAAAGQGMQG